MHVECLFYLHHRLPQQLDFLMTENVLSQQKTLCGTVSASLADWLLGSRPVGVCQAPYVPSTNLEEWVTQKCVSEPSQVSLLCTNLVFNKGENTVSDCGWNMVGIKLSVILFALPQCPADTSALTIRMLQAVTARSY